MGIDVDQQAVAEFGYYLAAEAAFTLPALERDARTEGLSRHGFIGAMEPVGEYLHGDPMTAVSDAFGLMQVKLCTLGDALIDVAKHYDYVEEDNRSLLERTRLENAQDRDVTTGDMSDFPGYYGRTTDHGESPKFPRTETEMPVIERSDSKFSDDIKYSTVLDIINFVWEEFEIAGGKDFVTSLIEPLSGKPESIRANGAAWAGVGKNFGLLAGNLGNNATTLLTRHWDSDAATAFEHFFDRFWKKGAAWAGQQLGDFIADGFDKLAEVSTVIAKIAIRLVNQIVGILERSVLRSVPVVGQAWTIVEQFLDFLGFDVDGILTDIANIRLIFIAIEDLIAALEGLVGAVEAYFGTLVQLIATIKQIPDVDSLTDAAKIGTTIKDQKGELRARKEAIKEKVGDGDTALGELDAATNAARNRAEKLERELNE